LKGKLKNFKACILFHTCEEMKRPIDLKHILRLAKIKEKRHFDTAEKRLKQQFSHWFMYKSQPEKILPKVMRALTDQEELIPIAMKILKNLSEA
jgi:transcription initiation factor TFIIIB Brf1 subunit/transcription initiation factor TFIIB